MRKKNNFLVKPFCEASINIHLCGVFSETDKTLIVDVLKRSLSCFGYEAAVTLKRGPYE